MKEQIWGLLGTTGYTLQELTALTFPQFSLLLEGQGPILFPRLRPQIEAAFANLSSKPGPKGEKSDTRKLIEDYEKAVAARKNGTTPPKTPEQLEREQAWKIYAAYYLGASAEEKPKVELPPAMPLPGMPKATAQAVIAYASQGRFPSHVWARDLAPIWRQLEATATLA